jgi:hypothetical protein
VKVDRDLLEVLQGLDRFERSRGVLDTKAVEPKCESFEIRPRRKINKVHCE